MLTLRDHQSGDLFDPWEHLGHALDIRRETDAYLCPRTLRNYRRRVIQLQLDQVLFRTLTDRLIRTLGVGRRLPGAHARPSAGA